MTQHHEEAFINAFVIPTKRSRFLGFLRNARNRKKFLAELTTTKYLDLRFAFELRGALESLRDRVEAQLKERGAPETCFLISEYPEFDGQKMLLAEALDRIVGSDVGTFVSCIPGRLGYFESEYGRWIFQK